MCLARRVPSSGTLTVKSLRTSSRNASNSVSDLSISSMSNTQRRSDVIERSSGRGRMKRSEKKTSSSLAMRSTASRSDEAPPITSPILSFRICV